MLAHVVDNFYHRFAQPLDPFLVNVISVKLTFQVSVALSVPFRLFFPLGHPGSEVLHVEAHRGEEWSTFSHHE